MKNLLCATVMGCALSLYTIPASADHSGEQEAHIIQASYVLPSKDGEEFRKALHSADADNMQLMQQIQAGNADLYNLLTAHDFDHDAFLTKAKELRDLQEQTKENRDYAFVSATGLLTPGERIKLAKALERGPVHHAMQAPVAQPQQ